MNLHDNMHAHLSAEQADCDGILQHNGIIPSHGDVGMLHAEVLRYMVRFSCEDGRLTADRTDQNLPNLVWHEVTDEGSRMVSATYCEDETCSENMLELF